MEWQMKYAGYTGLTALWAFVLSFFFSVVAAGAETMATLMAG